MFLIRCFRFIIAGLIMCCFVFPMTAISQEPALTGEFPFEDVSAIYAGPFMRADRSDLLVLHDAGGIMLKTNDGNGWVSSIGTNNLVLYSFDGTEFHKIWTYKSAILKYSMTRTRQISRTAWCWGDFDKDGRYSLVTCNVAYMQEYKFDEQYYERYKMPTRGSIKTPDVWLDQMIACDIDEDSCDEVVALEYLSQNDSSGGYRIGIYKIIDDSLVLVWRGLDGHVGGNYEVVPPNKFISKCRIDSIPGEVPVIQGSQSDVSLSVYGAICKTRTGDFEQIWPFPIPKQSHLRKDDPGAIKERELLESSRNGPVGGVIINDGNKVLHYGLYLDYDAPDHRSDQYSFSVLESGQWRQLKRKDPNIGGFLCRFTLEAGKTGWLFIRDGKYSFYDILPVIY